MGAAHLLQKTEWESSCDSSTHGLRNEVAPWHESAPQRLSFTSPRQTLVHSLCLLKVGAPERCFDREGRPQLIFTA
jgi:hypothetical protein